MNDPRALQSTPEAPRQEQKPNMKSKEWRGIWFKKKRWTEKKMQAPPLTANIYLSCTLVPGQKNPEIPEKRVKKGLQELKRIKTLAFYHAVFIF